MSLRRGLDFDGFVDDSGVLCLEWYDHCPVISVTSCRMS